MKDIVYSKAMKSYKILERITPLLPLIVVISDIIIFILLGIFIISLPQVPEAIVLLLIGILFTLSIILAIIGEAITDHYFNILDTYKNLAPKILCTMGTAIPIKLNNKRIKAYILKVKNTSKKTLHNLTVNVQGHGSQGNLKIDDYNINEMMGSKIKVNKMQ